MQPLLPPNRSHHHHRCDPVTLAMAVKLCISSLPCSMMLVIDSEVLGTCITLWVKSTAIMKRSERSSFSLLITLSALAVMRHYFAFVTRIVIHCYTFSNTAVACSTFNLAMTAVFEAHICCWVDCVIHSKLKGSHCVMLLFCWWFCASDDLFCGCI